MGNPTNRGGGDRDFRRWLRTWMLLSVPGAALAVLMWGPDVALYAIVPAMFGGAVRAMALTTRGGSVTPRELNRTCGETALAAALMAVSVAALGSLSPAAALAVVVLAGLTSPIAARHLRLAVGPGSRPEQVTPEPVHGVPPLLLSLLTKPAGRMTNEELCRAWRQSFSALEQTVTISQKAVLVQLRQCYLDEIEQRDALALRAWLESGARAAGGPDRFLHEQGPHHEDPEAA